MLDSMIRNPRPTRAEASDVANAIYDGTSAIMLSGETAVGKYPVETLEMMGKIADQAENNIDYWQRFSTAQFDMAASVTNAISHATCTTALDLKAAAIVTVTQDGAHGANGLPLPARLPHHRHDRIAPRTAAAVTFLGRGALPCQGGLLDR